MGKSSLTYDLHTFFSCGSLGHRASKYVVVRKQGISPVRVVAGTHFRLKKRAQKEASRLNRQFKDRKDIRFEVRREGWNQKR
jgi:hypothetical protein